MLSHFRLEYEKFSLIFGRVSMRAGLSPDFWTFFSLASSLVAAYFLMQHQYWLGLLFVIVMNLADMLDGATARASGKGTKFGSVLDHVVDRYAEFIVFAGLIAGGSVSPLMGMFIISGVIMASYVRAKAESKGGLQNCVVGIAGREEKLILMMLSFVVFALGYPTIAVILLFIAGLISHITAVQRLLYARQLILGPNLRVD